MRFIMRFIKIKGVLIALSAIGIIGIISLLVGFPIKWLWNYLMPVIFDLPEIGFWQASGIYFLSGMLFKNSKSKSKSE